MMQCVRCGAWSPAPQSPAPRPNVPAGANGPPGYGPAGFTPPPVYGSPVAYPPANQSAAAAAYPQQAAPPDLFRVPAPPRNPSPLARKVVFAYQGSQRVMLIIGVAFTLGGGLGTLPANYGIPGEAAILLSGKTTTGVVSKVELDSSHRINKKTATRIDVQFPVGAEKYEASCYTIDSAEIARAREPGARLGVKYSTYYPGFARVEGHSYSFFGWISLLFGIMPLVGVGMWFSAWRSNRREIQAFRHGTPVCANIVARTYDRTTKSNGRNTRVIKWQFVANGQTYDGSISHMDASFIDSALPGQQLIAVYDPASPAVNTVWLE